MSVLCEHCYSAVQKPAHDSKMKALQKMCLGMLCGITLLGEPLLAEDDPGWKGGSRLGAHHTADQSLDGRLWIS